MTLLEMTYDWDSVSDGTRARRHNRGAYVVAAAVYTKFGSRCNGATEEEQGVDQIQSQRDGSVAHEALIESDCYQVE